MMLGMSQLKGLVVGWVPALLLLWGCSSDGGDDGSNTGGGGTMGSGGSSGSSGQDYSAFVGTFLESQRGESDDCTSDPSLAPWSIGDYYRFELDTTEEPPSLVQHNCSSAASCSDSSSGRFRLNAGLWTMGGPNLWTSAPPCKYQTARFTLWEGDAGVMKQQDSLEAPIPENNGVCPQQVSQDLTCTHIFRYLMTRVD